MEGFSPPINTAQVDAKTKLDEKVDYSNLPCPVLYEELNREATSSVLPSLSLYCFIYSFSLLLEITICLCLRLLIFLVFYISAFEPTIVIECFGIMDMLLCF